MNTLQDIVPLEQFVASAKMQLKINTTDEDIWFGKLANEGIGRLKCLSLIKKNVAEFDICDNKIKLCSSVLHILGLRLGTGNNCSTAIYVDMPFLQSCGCTRNPSVFIADAFEINDGFIWFHGDIRGAKKATISFTSYKVDSDGLKQAQAEYESAITYFICYHYALQNYLLIPRDVRAEYWEQWLAQRRIVINSDSVRSFRDTKAQIQEIVSALIIDRNVWLLQ